MRRFLFSCIIAGSLAGMMTGCGSKKTKRDKDEASRTVIPRDSLLFCIKELAAVLSAGGGEKQLQAVIERRSSQYKIRLNQPEDTTRQDVLQVSITSIQADALPPAHRVDLHVLPRAIQDSLNIALLQQSLGPWQQQPGIPGQPIVFVLPVQAGQHNKVTVSLLSNPQGADTLHAAVSSIVLLGSQPD